MPNTITALTMPKFGLAMTEGKLASWTVPVGQSVQQGDELADIETTKITSSYESPAAGVLRKQVAQAGETRPVGALIGVLADAETPDVDIEASLEDRPIGGLGIFLAKTIMDTMHYERTVDGYNVLTITKKIETK